MVSKLFTIIRHQRKHMGFSRFQKADNRFLYGFRCTSIHFSDQGKTSFSLCEGHNCLASTFTQNSINFPIPQALTLIDDLWTLLYASTIRQFATAIVAAVSLAAFLLAAQMTMQISTSPFISQDMPIDSLVTDPDTVISVQPTRNLFWAPIQAYFSFDQHPSFWQNTICRLPLPFYSLAVGLLGTIAATSTIATQLTTDGGFMYSNHTSDLGLVVFHFLQRINLVSLYLGKLCVGSHKCSFDLVVREALILTQLTSLSTY